jgi:hypothetical protein
MAAGLSLLTTVMSCLCLAVTADCARQQQWQQPVRLNPNQQVAAVTAVALLAAAVPAVAVPAVMVLPGLTPDCIQLGYVALTDGCMPSRACEHMRLARFNQGARADIRGGVKDV